jgi:hypothetical protein
LTTAQLDGEERVGESFDDGALQDRCIAGWWGSWHAEVIVRPVSQRLPRRDCRANGAVNRLW